MATSSRSSTSSHKNHFSQSSSGSAAYKMPQSNYSSQGSSQTLFSYDQQQTSEQSPGESNNEQTRIAQEKPTTIFLSLTNILNNSQNTKKNGINSSGKLQDETQILESMTFQGKEEVVVKGDSISSSQIMTAYASGEKNSEIQSLDALIEKFNKKSSVQTQQNSNNNLIRIEEGESSGPPSFIGLNNQSYPSISQDNSTTQIQSMQHSLLMQMPLQMQAENSRFSYSQSQSFVVNSNYNKKSFISNSSNPSKNDYLTVNNLGQNSLLTKATSKSRLSEYGLTNSASLLTSSSLKDQPDGSTYQHLPPPSSLKVRFCDEVIVNEISCRSSADQNLLQNRTQFNFYPHQQQQSSSDDSTLSNPISPRKLQLSQQVEQKSAGFQQLQKQQQQQSCSMIERIQEAKNNNKRYEELIEEFRKTTSIASKNSNINLAEDKENLNSGGGMLSCDRPQEIRKAPVKMVKIQQDQLITLSSERSLSKEKKRESSSQKIREETLSSSKLMGAQTQRGKRKSLELGCVTSRRKQISGSFAIQNQNSSQNKSYKQQFLLQPKVQTTRKQKPSLLYQQSQPKPLSKPAHLDQSKKQQFNVFLVSSTTNNLKQAPSTTTSSLKRTSSLSALTSNKSSHPLFKSRTINLNPFDSTLNSHTSQYNLDLTTLTVNTLTGRKDMNRNHNLSMKNANVRSQSVKSSRSNRSQESQRSRQISANRQNSQTSLHSVGSTNHNSRNKRFFNQLYDHKENVKQNESYSLIQQQMKNNHKQNQSLNELKSKVFSEIQNQIANGVKNGKENKGGGLLMKTNQENLLISEVQKEINSSNKTPHFNQNEGNKVEVNNYDLRLSLQSSQASEQIHHNLMSAIRMSSPSTYNDGSPQQPSNHIIISPLPPQSEEQNPIDNDYQFNLQGSNSYCVNNGLGRYGLKSVDIRSSLEQECGLSPTQSTKQYPNNLQLLYNGMTQPLALNSNNSTQGLVMLNITNFSSSMTTPFSQKSQHTTASQQNSQSKNKLLSHTSQINNSSLITPLFFGQFKDNNIMHNETKDKASIIQESSNPQQPMVIFVCPYQCDHCRLQEANPQQIQNISNTIQQQQQKMRLSLDREGNQEEESLELLIQQQKEIEMKIQRILNKTK